MAKTYLKVDLSNLPRCNNGYIDWSNSIGYIVKFIYNDNNYELQILHYTKQKKSIEIMFKDTIITTRIMNLKKGCIPKIIAIIDGKSIKQKKRTVNELVKVDLSNIPKNNNHYSWADSVGQILPYTYNSISGSFQIKDYKNGKLYCVNLNNNRERWIYTTNIINGNIVTFVNKSGLQKYSSQIQQYNIGDIVVSRNTNKQFKILAMSYRNYEHANSKAKYGNIYYYVACKDCGDRFWFPQRYIKKIGCMVCAGLKVSEGINDIPTTAPWMIDFFQKGYDEAKQYTRSSGKEIYPKCPYCGKVSNKLMYISNLYTNKGFNCTCSDGIPYPEKFMMGVLDQIGIDYIYQASTKHIGFNTHKKVYDFYIPSLSCIIETHGLQHYQESPNFYISLKEQQKNDAEKKKIALENGIKNYYQIDCRQSELVWIKNSTENSGLLQLINLSTNDIDWNICDYYGRKNMIKDVCEYYNTHDTTPNKMAKIYHIRAKTICDYLKKGKELGWCIYTPSNIFFSSEAFEVYNLKKEFICFGKSSKEFSRCSKEILGVYLNSSCIRKCIKGEIQSYKGFIFKKIDDINQKREVLCSNDSF